MDSIYKATHDLDYLSDKGLLMILNKDYEKAIKLYLEIERIAPGRYATASNIGTAYELNGEDGQALKWISKAVTIDPKSHKSSEWIHVNILKAKINGPQYYNALFLVNTDFGVATLPHTTLTAQEVTQLDNALYYQLNERMSFVVPKDKIVAELLSDLGDIAFLNGRYLDAVEDYDAAKKYGLSGVLLERRLEAARRFSMLNKIGLNQTSSKGIQLRRTLLIVGGAVLLWLSASVLIFRRKRVNG